MCVEWTQQTELSDRKFPDHHVEPYLRRLHIMLSKGWFDKAHAVIDLAETEMTSEGDCDGLLCDQPIIWAVEQVDWETQQIDQRRMQLCLALESEGYLTIGDLIRSHPNDLAVVPNVSKWGVDMIGRMMSHFGYVWPVETVLDRPISRYCGIEEAIDLERQGVVTLGQAINFWRPDRSGLT